MDGPPADTPADEGARLAAWSQRMRLLVRHLAGRAVLARGEYAAGGRAYGAHGLDGTHQDRAAQEFFDQLFESVGSFFATLF